MTASGSITSADSGNMVIFSGGALNSGSAFPTVTLDTTCQVAGFVVEIKKMDHGAFIINTANGAKTIDGLAQIFCYVESFRILWDNTLGGFRTEHRQRGLVDFGSFSLASYMALLFGNGMSADTELQGLEFDATTTGTTAGAYTQLRGVDTNNGTLSWNYNLQIATTSAASQGGGTAQAAVQFENGASTTDSKVTGILRGLQYAAADALLWVDAKLVQKGVGSVWAVVGTVTKSYAVQQLYLQRGSSGAANTWYVHIRLQRAG